MRIDQENIRIATRIMQQKATLTRREFNEDYNKIMKTKRMLKK